MKYFGTDGIRGRVGEEPITPNFAIQLGMAFGYELARGLQSRPTVLIGKDTRLSGYMFESALQAGLIASGCDPILLGPLPTPAIAFLVVYKKASGGIVISASHNPFDDNGFKLLDKNGRKITSTLEVDVEKRLCNPKPMVSGQQLGRASREKLGNKIYLDMLRRKIGKKLSLTGLKVVIDCANGADYKIAPSFLSELGADVHPVGIEPDGMNINYNCGATNPSFVSSEVVRQNADLGVALDGDGDRVVLVDSLGNLVNGDLILYIIALAWKKSGRSIPGIVGTVMTNYSLEKELRRLGIGFLRSNVGDKNVAEMMRAKDWPLGGESSGHILFGYRYASGDGLLASVFVLHALQTLNDSLRSFNEKLQLFPQVVVNVPLNGKTFNPDNIHLKMVVKEFSEKMNDEGRILLRKSGTEPLVRVMAEGKDPVKVNKAARFIAEAVEKSFI